MQYNDASLENTKNKKNIEHTTPTVKFKPDKEQLKKMKKCKGRYHG